MEQRLVNSQLAQPACNNRSIYQPAQPPGPRRAVLPGSGWRRAALDHLRPTRALMAPTRLLVPLPTALSGRVRTVTSPLTLVRQLRR